MIRRSYPLFALAALLTTPFASSQAAPWPQYRGPNGDGTTPERVSPWPPAGPSPLWKVPTANGFSSFTIRDGRAFTQVLSENEGVKYETLLCLDANTGKQLWSAPVGLSKYDGGGDSGTRDNSGGDGPRSTPSVDETAVYVLSSDLVLTAFDLQSGKPIWKRDILKETKGKNITWKNSASPLLEGNLIFVAGGGEGKALLGINKKDGAIIWAREKDKMTHATPVAATIHGIRQVIFFTQTGLVSVKPETGDILWRHPYRFNISTAASPVVAGNIVFCSAGYGVGASAIEIQKKGSNLTANELWRETGNELANHWSTPVYKDGHLYGMFQFKEYGDGPVKCVELKTGKVKWSKPGFGPGNLILADDQLIILGDAGQVVLADATPEKYTERARFQAVTGKCWSTPTLSDGRLYIRSTKQGAAFPLTTPQQKLSLHD